MRLIHLSVDMTDAARRLVGVVADLPVQPGTTASFTTPLWLCASHTPNGPVAKIAGLLFTADDGRRTLKWRRDATQTHIYHVDVPSGVTTVRASFDAVSNRHLTSRMNTVKWEGFMMHPANAPMTRIVIQPTVRILGNWDYATSLQTETETRAADGSHKTIGFKPVTAERLEDATVLIGRYLSQNNITKDGRHQLCIAFGEEELTKIPQDRLDKMERLIHETAVIFGPGPYQQYKFLFLASDLILPPARGIGGAGAEQAESCFCIAPGRAFADDALFDWMGEVSGHEYVHVWNGKYRRPAGHVPSDFTTPLDGTLLWVYEGLTQYYGLVLAARSGLATPATVQAKLALAAADMACQSGRAWYSTEDTARGTSLRHGGPGLWDSYLRGADFYDEGTLLWLDVDTLIRERSRGARSLDDFSARFFDAKGATRPLVVPYTLEEVVTALNATLEYDWAAFIEERVQTPQAQVNLAGFTRAGYDFVYGEKQITWPSDTAQREKAVWHSLGVLVNGHGAVLDVRRFSQADKAGLAPSQTIMHVGESEYSLDALTAAIEVTKGREDGEIRVSLTCDEESWDASIPHTIGLVYPALERNGGPDLLTNILAPRAARE